MTELVDKILDIVLEEHAPDVTSYDAGWLDDCQCDALQFSSYDDGDKRWATYRVHLREVLDEMLNQPGAMDV